LFNERHHSTFDSKPKNVIAEATRKNVIADANLYIIDDAGADFNQKIEPKCQKPNRLIFQSDRYSVFTFFWFFFFGVITFFFFCKIVFVPNTT